MKAFLTANFVDSATSGVSAREVEETCDVEGSQAAFWVGSPFNT